MESLPVYELKTFGNADELPEEAEELFSQELAESRKPLPADRSDRFDWLFLLTCAVTDDGHVLGGAHLDIGPVNGDGPLATARLAHLEFIFVRPEHRRRGLGMALLLEAMRRARTAGAEYVRCTSDWDNAAETALFRKCEFALVDLNGEEVEDPC